MWKDVGPLDLLSQQVVCLSSFWVRAQGSRWQSSPGLGETDVLMHLIVFPFFLAVVAIKPRACACQPNSISWAAWLLTFLIGDLIALSGQLGGVRDNQGKTPLLLVDLMSLGRQGGTPITFLSVFTVAADGRANQVRTEDNNMIDLLDEICPYAISNWPLVLRLLEIGDWRIYNAGSSFHMRGNWRPKKNLFMERERWGSR